MSPTNANRKDPAAAFTLVETVVALVLCVTILGGIVSGYTFLAQNFARQLNTQEQDTKSRRAIYLFSQDISAAIKVYHPSDPVPAAPSLPLEDTSLNLTLPNGLGSTKVVSYSFDPSARTLTRTENAKTEILLTKLVEFDPSEAERTRFKYFNKAGSLTSAANSIKEIELKFTSAISNAAGGNVASYKAVSSRLVLRNKALLQ